MSDMTPTFRHPASMLLNLIVTLLTPMFLVAAEGNLTFARQAAMETLTAYRIETQSDLITIAKIIGFGLAALAALSLSMQDDLPITAILRLHASANASDRSEHRNRRTLKPAQPQPPLTAPDPAIDEAALTAAAAEMQARTAENLRRVTEPTPSNAATSTSEQERRYQATWAASAATVAAETAASLPHLSPQERQSAAIWINVLNESAKDFIAGNIAPRPDHGDLAGLFTSNT